jgi:hypothetical protein
MLENIYTSLLSSNVIDKYVIETIDIIDARI